MHNIYAAFRQFRKTPGFAITVVLTIALGIGANTAIFTLVHAVLLRSLPVHDPGGLYQVGDNVRPGVSDGFPDATNGGDFNMFSNALYEHLRATTPQLRELAAVSAPSETMSVRVGESAGKAEPMEYVSGNYFDLLGVGPSAGRVLSNGDNEQGAAPVAVLSYAAWQSIYGSNPDVVGESFEIEGHPITVVGVAAPGFFGDRIDPNPPALWMPLADEPLLAGTQTLLRNKSAAWLDLLGRLQPGVTLPALDAELTANVQHWVRTVPAYTANGQSALIARQYVTVIPGGRGILVLQNTRKAGLDLLMGICALVLLVACANVANLLLARGSAHRADTALRMALGAARGRVIGQMLTESVILACLGGAAGLTVAYAGTRLILSLAFPHATQLPVDPHPSLPVLGFAFALSLATGVVFGIVPAWINSHADPAEALRGVNRSTRDRGSVPQKALIVFQAALSLVLLVGAGLLTQSLTRLQHQDLGLQTANRYVVKLDPASAGYTPATLPSLYQSLQQRFGSLPGIAKVGLALYPPLDHDRWGTGIYLPGRKSTAIGGDLIDYDRVGPQYFEAVGQTIRQGRGFTEEDTAATQDVAVVNEAFVRRFFPHENAIGHYFGPNEPQMAGALRIVGVVADTKYDNPEQKAAPMFFQTLAQPLKGFSLPGDAEDENRSLFIDAMVLDFASPPPNVDALVRRTLAEINPNLTITSVQPFAYQVRGNFDEDRLLSRLTMLFGLLALAVAAVGLYGITAYQVARRTSEIGVRMALGATRGDVLRMVLRGAYVQVGLGMAIGIPAAIAAARAMRSQLYDTSAFDPISLLVAIGALVVAASIAAAIPARRAASIEPVTALRME